MERMLDEVELTAEAKVLEPSFGDGAFILPLLRRLMAQHNGSATEQLTKSLAGNLYGVELDERLYRRCLQRLNDEFGSLPTDCNLVNGDFFRHEFIGPCRWDSAGLDDRLMFDLIIGNPPFGGTLMLP